MGYKTRVQRIDRGKNRQYYIMCPAALAESLELRKGEDIEWIIENKYNLQIKRKRLSNKKARKEGK